MINRFSFLVLLFLALTANIYAQKYDEDEEVTDKTENVLVNKKGHPILPKQGDFSIGVSAVPYLEYLGNFFGKSNLNTLSIDDANIFGRYYLDEKSAIRFNFYIKNSNKYINEYVPDTEALAANPSSTATVKDVSNIKDNEYGLIAGYQMFRGYRRLRGFYGGQVGYVRSNIRTFNKYGNPLNNNNPVSRVLKDKGRPTDNIILGALAGVEYYFAPKMCIGAELHLNAVLTLTGKHEVESELWDGSRVVKTTNVEKQEGIEVKITSSGHGKEDIAQDMLPSASQAINDISAATIYLMFTF